MNSLDPIAQARALVPLLAAHADEAERQRRLHDAVVAGFEESRLFSLLSPPARGGRRVRLTTFLETIATLGEGCLSSAWVCSFYAVHAWMVCLFDPRAQDEALRDGGVRAPGLVAPKGSALPVDGGHRVSGRWEFGSGSLHAEWALISSLTRDSLDGPPTGARLFLLPRADIEVIDTWHVDGMAATESCDVALDDVFVPLHRSLDVLQMATGTTPGASLYPDDSLYRKPLPPLLAFVASAPALGAARATLSEFADSARGRRRSWASGRQAQRPAVQMRLAEASMKVRSAELLLHQVAEDLESLASDAPMVERARLRMQCSWALTLCTEAVQSLAEVAGASAHQHREPLQRRVRDLRVMRCHVIFEPDATAELYGRTLLGLDPDTLLL